MVSHTLFECVGNATRQSHPGRCEQKIKKSRNICRVSGGGGRDEVPHLPPRAGYPRETTAKLVKKLLYRWLKRFAFESKFQYKIRCFCITCRHAVLIGPFKSTAFGTNRRAKGVEELARARTAMGFSLVFRERVSETLGNRCCFCMFLFLFPVSVRTSPSPYFFLSFFLGFRRPNLITGLSRWRTPD